MGKACGSRKPQRGWGWTPASPWLEVTEYPRSPVLGLTSDTHREGEERTFLESDLTRQGKG